jgi:hypothetical protein
MYSESPSFAAELYAAVLRRIRVAPRQRLGLAGADLAETCGIEPLRADLVVLDRGVFRFIVDLPGMTAVSGGGAFAVLGRS